MKKILFISILFILNISCQKSNEKEYKENVLGDWKLALIEEDGEEWETLPSSIISGGYGYIFKENHICEQKNGFFHLERKPDESPEISFLGTRTSYKIHKDTLRIYDVEDKKWYSGRIIKLSQDAMILDYDGQISSFIRQDFSKIETLDYDQIILSSSGCFGECPVMNISVNKDGKVYFQGQHYTENIGFFESQISEQKFNKIKEKFDESNINQLKEVYAANHTDDENIDLTIIKDRKILKTISDYGKESPDEFIWAYTYLRFLQHTLKLDSMNGLFNQKFIFPYVLHSKEYAVSLDKTVLFFLETELLKAKEVKTNFDEKYTFELGEMTIPTDGRFFKIKDKTLDLGYNFIDRNKLLSKKKIN